MLLLSGAFCGLAGAYLSTVGRLGIHGEHGIGTRLYGFHRRGVCQFQSRFDLLVSLLLGFADAAGIRLEIQSTGVRPPSSRCSPICWRCWSTRWAPHPQHQHPSQVRRLILPEGKERRTCDELSGQKRQPSTPYVFSPQDFEGSRRFFGRSLGAQAQENPAACCGNRVYYEFIEYTLRGATIAIWDRKKFPTLWAPTPSAARATTT